MHSIKIVERAFFSCMVCVCLCVLCMFDIGEIALVQIRNPSMLNEQIHPKLISMLVNFMTQIHHHSANENIFELNCRSVYFTSFGLSLFLSFVLFIHLLWRTDAHDYKHTHSISLCRNKKSITLHSVFKHKSRGPRNILFIYIFPSRSMSISIIIYLVFPHMYISFRFLFSPRCLCSLVEMRVNLIFHWKNIHFSFSFWNFAI